MHDGKMHGTLWKWTNYFSGWQPRWFVLEDGILSYYKSEDDVINGCKGSIKMAVCDVHVHGTDMSRLDLIIPGEAHFYVRAASPQERQQWLVALGSAKACLTNGKATVSSNSSNSIAIELPEEGLKVKKSELRLYCDLLMQQVHSVKSAVHTDAPSVEKLTEATTLLTATCDTFIKTLEDCMKMANAHTIGDPSLSIDANLSPAKKSPANKTVPWDRGTLQRSMSVDRYIPPVLKVTKGHRVRSGSRTISENSESSNDVVAGVGSTSGGGGSTEATPPPQGDDLVTPGTPGVEGNSVVNNHSLSSLEEEEGVTIATFFSEMPANFSTVDIHNETGIPTDTFLEACRPILPMFDKLNPTAFAPVKLDIAGNIRKIQQKLISDPTKFDTLQKIIEHEVLAGQHSNPNCATLALLWLKRGLEFIREFLREYLAGVDDLHLAANVAYGKTLKAYHSWVVRGVFALAVKATPTKQDFLRHLAADPADVSQAHYERRITRDMSKYVKELDTVLTVIHEFYSVNGLDSDDQV